MKHVIAIAMALAVGAVSTHASRDASNTVLEQAAERVTPCEVVIAGMYHEYVGRSFGPAHLQALYSAVRPSLIAIEAAPSSINSGTSMPSPPLNEDLEALEYGRRTGVPVVGVDWEWSAGPPDTSSPPPPAPRAAGLSEVEARRLQIRSGWASISRGYRTLLASVSDALAVMNTASFGDMEHELNTHRSPYPGFDKANDAIAANIRRLAVERCGGARMLVTFGDAHRPELERRLAGEPAIHLRPVTDWLPLSAAAVAAQERPEDLWKILQLMIENLEMPSNPEVIPRDWLREKLPEMEQRARTDPEAKYYLARSLTVIGEWDRATTLLREVARDAGDRSLSIYNPATIGTIWFWPPETNLRRRALFAAAVAQDLAGHRDAAVETYRSLKAEIEQSGAPQPPPGPGARPRGLIPWLDRFIAEPYTGHPDQYLRVIYPG
jgi:hypothetical protein